LSRVSKYDAMKLDANVRVNVNRSTELERIATGCKYDVYLLLFDYILCKVELYAAEIATWRDECNEITEFSHRKHRANET